MQFQEDGVARKYDAKDLPRLQTLEKGFFWLHFDLVDARSGLWVNRQQFLPDIVRGVFLGADPDQRLDHVGPWLFGVFSDVSEQEGLLRAERNQLRFIMGPYFLITGRRQPLDSLRRLYEDLQGFMRFCHPSALLEAFVQIAIKTQRNIVESLGDVIDKIEDRVLEDRLEHNEHSLSQARRRLVHLHRNLSAIDALFRRFARYSAELGYPPEVTAAAQRILQQIQTQHADVHALQERARLMREEIESRQAKEMNNNLFVLSILSALLLPPSLVFSYFGVNAGGLALTDWQLGAVLVLVLGVASSACVYYYLRRRQRF